LSHVLCQLTDHDEDLIFIGFQLLKPILNELYLTLINTYISLLRL
jgi:hypothetical protein